MIRYENKMVSLLSRYLNESYPNSETVNLILLNGYDTVGEEKDHCGFAVYHRKSDTNPIAEILAAGDPVVDILKEDGEEEISEECEKSVRDEIICECILHEFRHHIQFTEIGIENISDLEEDAENFAISEYEKFEGWMKENEKRRNDYREDVGE